MMIKKIKNREKVPDDDAFIPPAAGAHLRFVMLVDAARSLTGTVRVYSFTRDSAVSGQ